MSRDPRRVRIDYQPGPAALAAIDEAAALSGNGELSKQALLDKLVLWGLWCAKREQDRPPQLFGSDRAKWASQRMAPLKSAAGGQPTLDAAWRGRS